MIGANFSHRFLVFHENKTAQCFTRWAVLFLLQDSL